MVAKAEKSRAIANLFAESISDEVKEVFNRRPQVEILQQTLEKQKRKVIEIVSS
jgi:capsular polysaccharide biosynthesis protein